MENTTTNPDVLERFLRYVQINTQSEDANCGQVPSSAVQFDLANVLAEELRELGAEDAHVTEHSYVCAHIPASAGAEDKPALGLIAHLDTTEVAPGAGVKPHIVRYEGGDLVCGTVDGKPVAMSTAKLPALNDLAGEDLVCSDGTTLLGADDKAGVARSCRLSRASLRTLLCPIPHSAFASALTRKSATEPSCWISIPLAASTPTRSTAAPSASWSGSALTPPRRPSALRASPSTRATQGPYGQRRQSVL